MTTRVLNDSVMPFATEFFDSGNATIVMTKDYINCERTYLTIFDGARGLTATVNDVANVMNT